MKVLICLACESGAGPQLSFGRILASIGPSVSLRLLHVLAPGSDVSSAEACLLRAREQLEGATVETKMRHGNPFPEIASEMDAGDFDLVVVGPNEAPGLKRYLLGSVTTEIVRRAPCSVLVAQQARSHLSRILICTGGADVADDVIKGGAWIAQAAGAHATLLHVVTPVPSMYTGLHELDESLPELLQTDTPIARHLRHGAEILERRDVPADLRLRYGVVADEIIREAREGHDDLILVGAAKGRAKLRRLILGDVTEQVVERSTCSMLIIRGSIQRTL